jgi:hypothetical protein
MTPLLKIEPERKHNVLCTVFSMPGGGRSEEVISRPHTLSEELAARAGKWRARSKVWQRRVSSSNPHTTGECN